MAARKKLPNPAQESKPIPSAEMKEKEMPTPTRESKGQPSVGVPENTIKIGEKIIEIKPTKLKYVRNRTAAFYKIIEMYSVVDVAAMEEGSFGDNRDGDKALMDWLIAVTDDEQLILDNYDSLDVETIERLLLIYKRVNKIDEKEEREKNMRAARREVT